MPIQPNPQPIQGWPNQVIIPVPDGTGLYLALQVQSTDGTAEDEDVEAMLQNLVDYLQAWPGRHPGQDVTAQKYETWLYTVTPTNPIPPPPPPLPETP